MIRIVVASIAKRGRLKRYAAKAMHTGETLSSGLNQNCHCLQFCRVHWLSELRLSSRVKNNLSDNCLLHQGLVTLQPLGLLYAMFSRSSRCPTRRESSKRREGEL
jgi:hypothetical protein